MAAAGFEPTPPERLEQTIAYQSRVVTRVLKRPRYESTLTARVRLLHTCIRSALCPWLVARSFSLCTIPVQ